jgi:hypothetical protein
LPQCPPSLMPPLPVFASAVSGSSTSVPAVYLYNVSAASLTPVCHIIWAHPALAALQPSPSPEASDIKSYFLGDQNGVVITTSKCFLLATYKGEGGGCKVKVQRLSNSEASVMTVGSTLSRGGGSEVSDDGGESVVMVSHRSCNPSTDAAAADGGLAGHLSGRLFKRSSVLGRVSWTLQLMTLHGSSLSYTNKDGKSKTYDLTACAVSAPQVCLRQKADH